MDSMESNDWPWSDEQKRKYVWESLVEQGQNQESNDFYYKIYIVQNDGEFEPVFLSRSDQRTILKDFQVEGKIRLIEDEEPSDELIRAFGPPDRDPNLVHVELLDTNKSRKSCYSYSVQSLADLMKDIDLRNKVRDLLVRYFSVYDIREIKPKQSTTTDVLEDKDELLLLMEELGFVKINWDSLERQTHRVIGNRYIQVQFFGEKAAQFADALYGRKSVIRPKALEQVAALIKDLMSQNKLNEHFVQLGVPYSLLLDNQHSKQEMVYNVLLALSSTGEQEDIDLLHKILEEFAHPLIFQGDTKASVDFQYKVTKVIRYDGLSLLGGKVSVFDESDTKSMEDLERQEHELSAGLMETMSDVFDGNPFGQPQQKPQPIEQETQLKQDVNGHTYFNINIDNKPIQTVNLSDAKTSQAIENSSKSKSGIAPHLNWSQIKIRFDNGNDVSIWCDKEPRKSNYVEMGFEDSKKRTPNTQWEILRHMADNERFIKFDDANKFTKSLKSQKKALSKKLQDFFGITEEPFEYVKSEAGSGYLAVFELESENNKQRTYLGDIE